MRQKEAKRDRQREAREMAEQAADEAGDGDAMGEEGGAGRAVDGDGWHYIDMSGEEQGPYETGMMLGWVEQGHFDPSHLQVRRGDTGDFGLMQEVPKPLFGYTLKPLIERLPDPSLFSNS
jgi:hypothetical protein